MSTASNDLGITIDWKPIILWGGGAGILIGAWWGLWVTGFLLAWDRGWLYPGIEVTAEHAAWFRIPLEDSIPWAAAFLRIETPPSLLAALLWSLAIGAAAGAGIAGVGRVLKLDPDLKSLRAFRWSLRATVTPMAVAITLLAIGAAGAAIWVESATASSWLGWALFGAIFLAWLAGWFAIIPILVCDRQVAGSNPAPRWWRIRWPGRTALGVFVVLEIVTSAFDWLPSGVLWNRANPSVTAFAAGLAFVVLSIVLFVAPLVQCSVLMGSDKGLPTLWKRFFRWKVLGPWIALHGWWAGLALVLAPPALAVYVWHWKFAPVLATYLEGQDRSFPLPYLLFIDTINVIENFWWLLGMVPLMLFFWLGVARFVVLVDARNEFQADA